MFGMRKSKQSPEKVKSLPIGQTLETQDKYLKYNSKTSKQRRSSRPVIIADKQVNPKGEEEYAVIPGTTQESPHSTKYGKFGIKRYRHNIEVRDNEGKPIQQNDKFKVTSKSTKLPKNEAEKIKDKVLNHTNFSSENRMKMDEFKNRYKKQ